MKNNYAVRYLLITVLLLAFVFSCKKETPKVVPTITIITTTSITSTTAISGGNVSNDGGAAITARGVCWSINQNPSISDNKTTDGSGTGSFSSSITGLAPGTTYFLKSYAINSVGTSYSSQSTFTTTAVVPVLTTTDVSSITSSSASSGGNVTNDGGSSVIARGVCWSANQNPTTADSKTTDGIGTGSFNSNITGLSPNTTYYSRAYATNITGTNYGNTTSFKTLIEPVTDFDGNIYHTVTIGTQVWMVENLKTTHYRNGDPIPDVTNNSSWSNLTTGAYCDYNNDANNSTVYGRLYNWYAIKDNRNIAPTGWHVSTYAEWATMTTYLVGLGAAGSKLKETGTTHWITPNTGASNETGFTALPGGCRINTGVFGDIGRTGYWWSYTTEGPVFLDWYHYLCNDYSSLYNYNGALDVGLSVRCIKD